MIRRKGLYEVGTVCSFSSCSSCPMACKGLSRAWAYGIHHIEEEGYFTAEVSAIEEGQSDAADIEALKTVRGQFEQYARHAEKQGSDIVGPMLKSPIRPS